MRKRSKARPEHRRYTRLERLLQFVAAWPIGYGYIVYLGVTQRLRDVTRALLQFLRLLKFAGVGIGVAVIGYGVLYLMVNVQGLPSWTAYLIEGGLSVELNFLGSRYITWRDRRKRTRFWHTWTQFHVARGVTFGINQGLFNAQVWLFRNWPELFDFTSHGFYYGYMLANTACIVVSASFNYAANDQYVFAGSAVIPSQAPTVEMRRPRVCVVIPCKNNPELGRTVNAILHQAYFTVGQDRVQIVLVGNENEKSWDGVRVPVELEAWAEQSLHFLETTVHFSPGRDANIKRLRGLVCAVMVLKDAQGHAWLRDDDIVWCLDADVESGPDLLLHIINRISVQGYDIVGGPVPSRAHEQNRFWPLFIDTVGGKTPNWPHSYVLTIDNLGLNKMPVTANIAMRAGVVRAVGYPAEDFTNSFEDYEWFFRMLLKLYKILCDPALAAPREHLVGFQKLAKEYVRSGRGSRDYIVRHRDNNLFRTWQLFRLNAVPISLALLVMGLIKESAATLVLGSALVLSRMLGTLLRARRPAGLVYPFVTGIFAACAVYGNVWGFFRHGLSRQRGPHVSRTTVALSYSKVMQRQKRGGRHDAPST